MRALSDGPFLTLSSQVSSCHYMIHASDHEEAPIQMRRAYAHAVTADQSEQTWFPGMEPQA